MTDRELTDFIEHGENGFVDFALTFGDGWAIHAIEIAKELRARLAQPEKTDVQIGITYEEANPPEPYCKRCGKKLGTEAYDVHTCTPKFDGCDCDSPAWCNQYKKCHRTMLGFEPYVAPSKKEWQGLTYADLYFWGGELGLGELGKGVLRAVDAHLKEKNT